MRVKQTARKSTATPSGAQNQSQSQNDPVRMVMRNLLQTKRKSATPSSSIVKPETRASGMGKGKQITPRGKHINNSVKVKPKTRPGVLALKEIKRLQKGFDLLIPRASFHRLVREITNSLRDDQSSDPNYKYQAAALEALQEATETFMVRLFEDAYLCTIHAKRVTLFIQDMQLCQRLQRLPTTSQSTI